MTALGVTAALYLLNLGLGLGLQLRLFHLRYPALHHALYFVICLATLVTAFVLWRARAVWGPLVLSAAFLAYFSRTKAGKPAHALTAVGVGAGYALCWALNA